MREVALRSLITSGGGRSDGCDGAEVTAGQYGNYDAFIDRHSLRGSQNGVAS
jgi:hypothetical protein